MSHTIGVVTVVYNNYNDLDDYFKSFSHQSSDDFHVYVVDVSSKRQTVSYPSFASVLMHENKGYAAALNAGIRQARKDGLQHFICMNNDTTVHKDFITSALKSLQKHPGAIIGGKIYYSPGYEYHKERYKSRDIGHVIWYAGGHIDWHHAWVVHRGVDVVDFGIFEEVEDTGFVTGCLCIFDYQVIEKVGFMNESYFMYYEDADWCVRALQKNCRLIYDPSIIMWHKNAQSTGGSGSSFHEKYQKRNQLTFALRYAPLRTKVHVVLNTLFSRLQIQNRRIAEHKP